MEYEQIMRSLAFPVSVAEFDLLTARRRAILTEARLLAKGLNVMENRWFDVL